MKFPPKAAWFLLPLYFLAFTAVFVNTAWLCDDIFITFRAVDNFLEGYGPVWNVGERVQVYTHPLWYALLVTGIGIFGNHYWFTLALSYACLLGALFLFLKIAQRGSMALGALALLVLLLSRAFADYSSSGLENPLLHLLLCAYVLVAITQADAARRFFWTSALYGLLFLTRPDAIVPVTPASLWMFWQAYKTAGWRRTAKLAVLAIVPVLAWEAFSLIYYGSLVPNTAIAKTNLGYPRSELFMRGLDYFDYTLEKDPATLIGIVLAFVIVPFSGKNLIAKLLLGGVALQIAYIFWVGADYMIGRFLTTSLLLSAVAVALSGGALEKPRVLFAAGAATVAVLLAGSVWIEHASGYKRGRLMGHETSRFGIINERAFYYPSLGMLKHIKEKRLNPLGTRTGRAPETVTRGTMGRVPWRAGEKTYFIDYFALTDPYLARIPALPEQRIGHYRRNIPQGYVETLVTGRNLIADPALAALYDDVASATRGPLFSSTRWKSIWRLGTRHHKIRPDFPHHTLKTDTIPVPPAFSPFIDRNGAETNRVTKLEYALAYDDAASVQRLVASAPHDQKLRSDLTRAASGLWLPLISRAQRGQGANFQAVLAAGANVDAPDKNGNSALAIAAGLNDATSAKALLEHGANINKADKQGETALMKAAQWGEVDLNGKEATPQNADLIALLLARGADINATDNLGDSALTKAAKRGDIAMARLLLEHGAAMLENGPDERGKIHRRTPLIHAAWHGHKEMVQFLLERGVDVNAAGAVAGETALTNAAGRGHTDIVRLLLDRGANVNAVKKDAATALGLALSGTGNVPKRNRDMVHLLLAHGADVSAALPEAARGGSLQSVQFLVRKGADVNFADAPNASTPLMHAAWHGHRRVVAFLLAEKAPIDAINRLGDTALWHAAVRGHTEIAKLLLGRGAGIDRANNAGWTPLMEAASRGHTDTVRLLLASGADPHLTNRKGETALQLATMKKHSDVANMLRAAGAQK